MPLTAKLRQRRKHRQKNKKNEKALTETASALAYQKRYRCAMICHEGFALKLPPGTYSQTPFL